MSEPGSEIRLVYDFGMNIAEDTEYYLQRGFRVIAIEADPKMCAQAEERLSEDIGRDSLRIVNKAVGKDEGVFRFHVCEQMSAWSTASDELRDYWSAQGASFTTIEVPFCSAGKIIAEHGSPYYVKIDIEGHDQICLDQLLQARARPKWLSFELDTKRWRSALKACRAMGFTKFKLIDQLTVPNQRVPRDTAEGEYLDYRFKTGQTGPFGSDLDGSWLSYPTMSLKLLSLSLLGKLHKLATIFDRLTGLKLASAKIFAPAQTWYDVHAGAMK